MSETKTEQNAAADAAHGTESGQSDVVLAPMAKDYAPRTIGRWIVLLLQGMTIGVGAILPGISGGVLCVVFGIYPPMMELLAHPIKSLPKYFKLFIPIFLGWMVGFVALAGVIGKMFANDGTQTIATCLFIGLIIGMFPSLFREGARDGRTKTTWTALLVSTAALLTLFLLLKSGTAIHLTPSLGWFFFCGVLWGISLIVPGMSSSSVLIFLGLYGPMSVGIAKLDMAVVIPFMLGIMATVLLLARAVNRLFRDHYGVAFHCIIGFVIASTIPIIPLHYKNVWEFIISLICVVIGFFLAFYMDRWSNQIGAKAQTEQM
ncbi:MAG: DUF368 domain-containing protein [Clostridia bacterium]